MLTETPENYVAKCANDSCGNEISQGEEVFQFPSTEHYFCSQQCVHEQMLKEDNLRRVVAE